LVGPGSFPVGCALYLVCFSAYTAQHLWLKNMKLLTSDYKRLQITPLISTNYNLRSTDCRSQSSVTRSFQTV